MTRYGAHPLHLLAHVAVFGASAYAIVQILDGGFVESFLVWFLGAALLHDLVFLPLYSVLDRAAGRSLGSAINYLRAPVVLSALLLLVYFPLILVRADGNYLRSTGHHVEHYGRNWLLITAGLFAGSAAVYLVRRLRDRSAARRREHTAAARVNGHRIRLPHGGEAAQHVWPAVRWQLHQLVERRQRDPQAPASRVERHSVWPSGQVEAANQLQMRPEGEHEQRIAAGVEHPARSGGQARHVRGPHSRRCAFGAAAVQLQLARARRDHGHAPVRQRRPSAFADRCRPVHHLAGGPDSRRRRVRRARRGRQLARALRPATRQRRHGHDESDPHAGSIPG
jgi:hypothetical protein